MSRRLVLLRHARLGADLAGRLVGATDAPLDATGQQQAFALGASIRELLSPVLKESHSGASGGLPTRALPALAGKQPVAPFPQSIQDAIGPNRCYASPMLRCRQTVEAIFPEAVIPSAAVQFDNDLREIDFGRWETLSFEEAAASDPSQVERWAAFQPDFTFPEGENLGAFFRRAASAADRLAADEAPVVLAVTHGGVIRAMLCHLLGLEPRQHVAFRIDYGALAVVDVFDGRGVLSQLIPCEIPENAHG